MAVDQLTFHNDVAGTGADIFETALSPSTVKSSSFGKLFTTALDGNAYAEPLVIASNMISAGPNTVAGATGTHETVFVATMHDSVYAIDATTGSILWQRSFLSTANAGTTAGTDVNNPLGATAITAPTSVEISSTDITPTYGILGTPVIDKANGRMYLVTFTKEIIGGVATFVQKLHALSVSNGVDVAQPFVLGRTVGDNTNMTPIYVYGDGAGSVTDPYNGTGKPVVQFNTVHENQRQALTLINNRIYIGWGSHNDNDPYHGWVAAFDVSNLTTTGIKLVGVFCSSPNGGEAGIWGGGGRLSFEPDGNTFYLETGNGTGGHGGIVTGADGLPIDGAYYEAVVKLTVDSTTSSTTQSMNGWGLKVVDFFVPYNQPALDNADQDLGSGSPLVLPDSAGIPGHPHLLLASGKQGVVYVIDRDNMGKYDAGNDHVVNAVANGSGQSTPPVQIGGVLSTPVYFNGQIYIVSGYSGVLRQFSLSSSGMLVPTSQTAATTFGYLPGSPVLSSNGTTNGIIWQTDRATNELHAYDATSLSTELWNSNQKAGGADAVGTINKLTAPTVANGQVFVGTSNSLVAYGLIPPASAAPAAPALTAAPLSATSVNLAWTDSTVTPNTATGYTIEQMTGSTWTVITTAPGGSASLAVGGLVSNTAYQFRVRGLNGVGYSAYSSTVVVTTTGQVAAVDFAGGFAGSVASLQFNGTATVSGTSLQLTDGGNTEAGSVFSTTPVDVTKFTTSFTIQIAPGSTSGDGMTFTIEGVGPTALGQSGGGLGYGTDGTHGGTAIGNSVAIKLDLWSNAGEGYNSTGVFLDGADPTLPSTDLTASGIDLHDGDPFKVDLGYDGTTLTETITDLTTSAVFSQGYAVNIPAVAGGAAYVGFTAGSGGATARQDVLNWSFTPATAQAPAAPTALGAVVASATGINLTWTNNATNQTGYSLDRATDPGFTQNLLTQTIAGTSTGFADSASGLASGGTYYYRLRATNGAGASASSNVAAIAIPFAPPTPTGAAVEAITSTSISLTWQDHAATAATGYHVLRSVNGATYQLYATLPQLNAAGEYDWTDTAVTPGTYYGYHIQAFNVAGYNDFTGCNATTLPDAPQPSVVVNPNSVTLSWPAVFGAVAYHIYRGTTPGGEGPAPLATTTNPTFLDTTVLANTPYYYVVTAINTNATPVPSEGAPSVEIVTGLGQAKIAGVVIGSADSWSTTTTRDAAFDGNFNTYYDAATDDLSHWVGLDFGSPATVTGIQFATRPGFEYRAVGGSFQVSSTADFSADVHTIGTIASPLASGQLWGIPAAIAGPYRYARFVGGTEWVNVAEVEFDGFTTAPPPAKLSGTPIGTTSYWSPDRNNAAAIDGNGTTFFDPATGSLSAWTGIDLGASRTISRIQFMPRTGFEFRMVGGQFQASNTADFSSNVTTVYTVSTTPATGQWTSVNVNPGGPFRYVRYTGGTQWVNIADLEVDGPPAVAELPAVTIGSTTPWSPDRGRDKIFDGDLTTYFDAATNDLTTWVGLDLGSALTIKTLKFAPRPGYEYRMVGGLFQVSNTADFSAGVQTIYTVTTAPPSGVLTTVPLSLAGSWRYVRYTGGNQWVNIAEMEIDGIGGVATTPTKLAGTAIGAGGAWSAASTYSAAVDGDLSTSFDPATGGLTDWVGLDLGTTQTISQIKFAPRAGYEFRMVGGSFQASNTADFAAGVVTLYTVTSVPVAGQLTAVTVFPGSPFRYVRYVGGTQWVNIAEMEVDG